MQVLEVDLDRERISLSLKATQQDPWQEFATTHRVGELVYGRVTKLVPFGAFVQVGDGIEGLVHISEMSAHHVDLPEQVVTPGEELWVKIIDLDLAAPPHQPVDQAGRRGRRAWPPSTRSTSASTPTTTRATTSAAPTTPSAEEAWAEYYEQYGEDGPPPEGGPPPSEELRPRPTAEAPAVDSEARGSPGAAVRRACRAQHRLSERSDVEPGRTRRAHQSRQLDDAHPHGLQHGLRAVAGVELLVDRRQVVLHRLLADVQLLGHLGGASTRRR